MKRALIITFALTMLAAVGYAQGHGPEHGPGGGPGGGFGGPAIIGSDGTVYVTKASTTADSVDVVAISSTGTTIWTKTLADHGGLRLSNNNLISVSTTKATDGTVSSAISALSITTGAVAWTHTVSGHADVIGSFAGGTYFSVVVPPATQGGTATRSLVAISNSGTVLWTVSL